MVQISILNNDYSIFQNPTNPPPNQMYNQNAANQAYGSNNRSQSAPPPYKMGSSKEEFLQTRLDHVKKDPTEDYSYSSSLMQQLGYQKYVLSM
jgi:hypothetical protein